MNLTIIPFHDWRKSEKEGIRTRDLHFIKTISKSNDVVKVLVVNRPSTWLERLYKRQKKTIKGELILKKGNFTLTRVEENIFVVDYSSSDVINQVLKKYLWFIEKYGSSDYMNFINNCQKTLSDEDFYLICNNVFSYKLAALLNAKRKLFDAWDNFLKFPVYKDIRVEIEKGYSLLSKKTDVWSTNSHENSKIFKNKFDVNEIIVVKNGVKQDFLSGSINFPKDMANIKRPIIGYGGKISYLLDYNLINFITKDNPESSFVFVGQILDNEIYSKIKKRENVFFMGDKHYDVYPNYVRNFDICIVPYNIKEGQHGGDSMKAYEYLLTGKKVVGTKGNGLIDLEKYIYLVDNQEQFSNELKNLSNKKSLISAKDYSWETRANMLICALKKENIEDKEN